VFGESVDHGTPRESSKYPDRFPQKAENLMSVHLPRIISKSRMLAFTTPEVSELLGKSTLNIMKKNIVHETGVPKCPVWGICLTSLEKVFVGDYIPVFVG
jgi:hypothetical protein